MKMRDFYNSEENASGVLVMHYYEGFKDLFNIVWPNLNDLYDITPKNCLEESLARKLFNKV